jgi:exonuclease III
MPKSNITLKEKITRSIRTITKIMTPKPKVKKSSASKPKNSIINKSNIKKVRNFVANPLVQQIGLKLFNLARQSGLTIYTHNICWTESKLNHIRIAEKLETLQPDIFCLQECVFQSQSEIFNLPKYHKSIANSSGNTIVKGGLAIYSKHKPICIDFIKFKKQGRIFSQQLAERQLEKGFLVAEFESYLIINTHLVADHSKKWLDNKLKSNTNQVNELLQYIQTMNFTKPLIVCGDLNFTPKNNSYESMINSGLKDLSTKIPYTFITKKAKLDYIFSNLEINKFSAKSIKYSSISPSDHLAIFVGF